MTSANLTSCAEVGGGPIERAIAKVSDAAKGVQQRVARIEGQGQAELANRQLDIAAEGIQRPVQMGGNIRPNDRRPHNVQGVEDGQVEHELEQIAVVQAQQAGDADDGPGDGLAALIGQAHAHAARFLQQIARNAGLGERARRGHLDVQLGQGGF